MTQSLSTALSRFQITHGSPVLPPGKCSVCGTTSGSFIDFGLELDFYGVVYICIDNCFRELAKLLEYYHPDEVVSIKEQYNEIVQQNAKLIAYNKELNDVVDSFSRLRSNDFDTDSDQLALDLNKSEKPEFQSRVDESSDEIISDEPGEEPEGEDGSSEQDDESRSSSIHSDDSIDTILTESI